MDRLEPEDRARGEQASAPLPTLSVDEWRLSGRPSDVELRLTADAESSEDIDALVQVARIVIDFPAFMDGRGFSHGKRLRERGFTGSLIADGELLPDQWPLLERCGFTAIASEDLDTRGRARPRARAVYQGDALDPRPLFRRRS